MLLEIGNFHSITLPSSNERDIFDSLRFIEDFVKEILKDSLVPGQNRKGKTGAKTKPAVLIDGTAAVVA